MVVTIKIQLTINLMVSFMQRSPDVLIMKLHRMTTQNVR